METMEVEVETNSEGRDDWGHERDVRDHTGDGWDHVDDVVEVGESTKDLRDGEIRFSRWRVIGLQKQIHEKIKPWIKIQILQIFNIYLEI